MAAVIVQRNCFLVRDLKTIHTEAACLEMSSSQNVSSAPQEVKGCKEHILSLGEALRFWRMPIAKERYVSENVALYRKSCESLIHAAINCDIAQRTAASWQNAYLNRDPVSEDGDPDMIELIDELSSKAVGSTKIKPLDLTEKIAEKESCQLPVLKIDPGLESGQYAVDCAIS